MARGAMMDKEIKVSQEAELQIRAERAERERDELHAKNQQLLDLIAQAYGHLWNINNEPLAPMALYSPDEAAYQARRILRDTLTSEQRGKGIIAARRGIEGLKVEAAIAQAEGGQPT